MYIYIYIYKYIYIYIKEKVNNAIARLSCPQCRDNQGQEIFLRLPTTSKLATMTQIHIH